MPYFTDEQTAMIAAENHIAFSKNKKLLRAYTAEVNQSVSFLKPDNNFLTYEEYGKKEWASVKKSLLNVGCLFEHSSVQGDGTILVPDMVCSRSMYWKKPHTLIGKVASIPGVKGTILGFDTDDGRIMYVKTTKTTYSFFDALCDGRDNPKFKIK